MLIKELKLCKNAVCIYTYITLHYSFIKLVQIIKLNIRRPRIQAMSECVNEINDRDIHR